MYVILTSKPGQFRTEAGAGMRPAERWDYLFCGRTKARFVIAELLEPTRVAVIDETGSGAVNRVPSKLLGRFESVEAARRELESLCGFGSVNTELVRADATGDRR